MGKGWLWADRSTQKAVPVVSFMSSLQRPSQPLLGDCHPGGKLCALCKARCSRHSNNRRWVERASLSDRGFCPTSCLLSSAKYSRASSLSVLGVSRADSPPSLQRHRNAAFCLEKESQQEQVPVPAACWLVLSPPSHSWETVFKQRIELMGCDGTSVNGHCAEIISGPC